MGSKCAMITFGTPPKSTNIQINFGLSFRWSTYATHLQYPNVYCDYMHRNEVLRNNTEWVGSTLLLFVVGNVPPTRFNIECKVCRSRHVCISLWHARTIYIYSTSMGMSKICTHLGIHDHPLANDTCCDALNIIYQCIANEILKYYKRLCTI